MNSAPSKVIPVAIISDRLKLPCCSAIQPANAGPMICAMTKQAVNKPINCVGRDPDKRPPYISTIDTIPIKVPPNSTAVGVPARIVRIDGQKTNFAGDVDQISVTDPIANELICLHDQISALLDKKAKGE